MKGKPFIKYFDIGPYPVFFGFTDNEKAYVREVKRLGVKDPPEFVINGKSGTAHQFTRNDQLTVIVTINDKQKPLDQIVGLLVHEAVHVWQMVLAHIGETKWNAPEIEAYHIQNIAQCMIGQILKKRGVK